MLFLAAQAFDEGLTIPDGSLTFLPGCWAAHTTHHQSQEYTHQELSNVLESWANKKKNIKTGLNYQQEQIHVFPQLSTEQCWFIPAADVTWVTTLCFISRAGWCLEALCWSLVAQDPSLSWAPHVYWGLYILPSHAQCAEPVPRGHSTSPPSRSQLTCWPVMGSGTVHPGATIGKCCKSDFFHISQSVMYKVRVCQNTVSRKELILPSSCQIAQGDSKRLLKQINWKQGTSPL